jgi:hypothetical protein
MTAMTNLAVLEAGFIPRTIALPRSQNYGYLRARGLQYIERLAHLQWTDYNVHDPGVTILELLCYAITDVGLRAAYPMRDLLAAPSAGGTSVAGDFHLAHEVLVCKPVSFDDLRRLLIDIGGVRNAWIERHRGVTYALDVRHDTLTATSTGESIELNGLFNVYLEYEDFVMESDPSYRTRTVVGLVGQAGDGDYVSGFHKGLEFEALEDALLESVTVYADAAGTVTIDLLHRGEQVGHAAATIDATHVRTPVVVPLNFPLKAGLLYRMDGTGTTGVKLYRTKQATYPMLAPAPPAGTAGPVRILRGYAPGPTFESGRQSYYFFYNWQVAHDSSGLTKAEVRAGAIERIHANRNLCEDVVNVCDLVGEDVAICADIELRADADTDAVHAEILYRVFRFISPTVPFHSLDELLARGRTVDEIFDGPLLDHGFIDDAELKAIRRKCEIHASDIVQILMDVDGVIAVKSLTLINLSDPDHPEDWILPLSADRFRIAVFAPWDSKLIFYKRGLPYLTNRKAVEPLFAKKKAADVEDKLKVKQRELTAPAGTWRDVGAYEPVVNELPLTYRVGRIHVPASDPVRQAQSRQLTAYLMFFDQILANYLAQLSHVGDLFTWRDVDFRTYFTQQIAGVEGVSTGGSALDGSARQGYSSFLEGLQTIVETPSGAEERRLHFLEHLAARYAEEFGEYEGMMRAIVRSEVKQLPAWVPGAAYAVGARVTHEAIPYECLRIPPPAEHEDLRKPPHLRPATWRQTSRLIGQLRRFLEDYPALSAGRGSAFDWRWPDVPANVAGYQRRIYRLLDIDPVVRTELAGHRFTISDIGTAAVPAWQFDMEDEDGTVLFTSITCNTKSSIEALLDLALRLGGDETNYETTTGTTHLVQRCGEDASPDRLGSLSGPAVLADVAAYFARYAASEGCHVVEHILLRRRTTADPFLPVQIEAVDECCPTVRDPYSFRVSIVLPSWSPRFRDLKFRRFVEDTLRREAPAHVYPRICWVNHEQMKNLEIALEEWQDGLASHGRDAGSCADDDGSRTGRLPLPHADSTDSTYAHALTGLIGELYQLTNVYPLAQLHDCQEVDGDTPQITLGNTSLGTL